MKVLRDYQQNMLDKLIKSIADDNNPCVQLETGGGKSVIMAHLISYLISMDKFHLQSPLRP